MVNLEEKFSLKSDSEQVVAPKNWFTGSENENMDTSDIVPKSWRVI